MKWFLPATTHTIADWQVDDALRLQRERCRRARRHRKPGRNGATRAQRRLDALNAGMRLLAIEFKEIHPPRHVVAAFRDVQSAKIEIETLQREAEGFRASEIPKAEATMNSMVQEADAYRKFGQSRRTGRTWLCSRNCTANTRRTRSWFGNGFSWRHLKQVIESVGQLRFVEPRTRVIVAD